MNAAMVVGVIGAALVFALDDNDSIGPLNAQPLGGVLIGLALVLLVGEVISASKPRDGDPISDENLRAVTGLVAVVAGVVAIGALTIIAVELLDVGEEGSTEATVAITTSAFGIVSTVVTAYLGIKATANAGKVSRKEKNPPNEKEVQTGGE
jgi:hypothetical protein